MRPLLALPLLLVLGTPLAGQVKTTASPYYPLQVGSRWIYRSGDHTVTVRVVKHEPVAGVGCARVEAVEGATVRVEHVAVLPDGVYRYQADDKPIKPALCFLKLPPQAGATWKVDATVDSLKITGTFTLGQAEVAVPAGKFKAVTVTSTDLEIAGRKAPVKWWFAAGVGMVKQQLEVSGIDTVLELQSFTPAK
jgi:hypothetical protein